MLDWASEVKLIAIQETIVKDILGVHPHVELQEGL